MAAIGIDLGTTNSCVAVVKDGEPLILANSEGFRTTASVVAWTTDGQRLVGDMAKRQAITNAPRTVTCVKRVIGRAFNSSETTLARETAPYSFKAGPQGETLLSVADATHSPEELSAMILAKLRDAAEQYLGEEVREAVITVPAYFDDRQRRATRDAARIAGLEVLRLINEPTAAALAYGRHEVGDEPEVLVVYDLGGGTFDVTVLEIGDGIVHVRATHGDCFLGGEDFNARIVTWLEQIFLEQTGIDLTQPRDPMVYQRLVDAAERAKIELSSSLEATISLAFVAIDETGPLHLECTLTRTEYEGLVEDLVDRTIEACANCMEDAGLAPEQVDNLLLVGGQTRMPSVRTRVRNYFGKTPLGGVNPDEVVAAGAALQAGIVDGEVEDQVLLDVIPLSLGIETSGGVVTRLIERNSSVPTQAKRIFTTTRDDQDSVQVHVLQGEREMVADNRSLGLFELHGIPMEARGVAQIEVCFDVDQDGIVRVTAREISSGRSQRIRIHGAGGLSAAEIQRLHAEAEQHRQSDRARRERVQLTNELNGLAHRCRKSLTRSGESDAHHQRLGELVSTIERLRSDEQASMEDLRTQREEAGRVLAEAP